MPILFKLMSKVFFNTTNVMPDEDRISKFEQYLMEGDEPADKAVKDLFGGKNNHGKSFKLMRDAIDGQLTNGRELPSSFNELLLEAGRDPDWLDRDQLELGAAVCRRLGLNAMNVLGDLALLGGYANADISKPLTFTGQLKGENAFDRLSETSQFWFDVTREGALKVGGKGYKSAMRVRMMHAIVRQRLVAHPGWDNASWGIPINKADSASTNVAFSMAMIYGVKRLGFQLSNNEMLAILHLWRYIGSLMGDDTDWLPKTVEEGLQCLILINLSNKNQPDEDSLALAHDYLSSFKPKEDDPSLEMKLFYQFMSWRHRAFAEYLIPSDLYKKLQLPSSYLTWLSVPLIEVPFNFTLEQFRMRMPNLNQWVEERGSKQQEAIIKMRMGRKQATYKPTEELHR